MLEKTGRFQSDSGLENFDTDTNGPRFGRYPYPPANGPRRGVVPDDSVPLFLSDDVEDPELQNFVPVRKRHRARAITVSRILGGCLAVVSAAIIASLFSADTTRALIINAKASLAAVSWGQPGPSQPPAPKAQPANPVQLATTGTQATANVPPPPAPALAPTREEISAALKTARQSQVAIVQPSVAAPAPVPPAPSARKLDADTLAGMMKRARSLIATGDISSARLLLERAAEAQEASAAFLLGQTYDPAVLGTPDLRSITPDPATARSWYEKAAQLGSPDAQQRLAQMRN
ncbi:hypothetical protein [Bradyrhizobium canariense]|uniref:Sel1 repeat-containing protein n=1 Tax=Bradyrhizobium canariense TaxID=255045 RepID=A0A1H1YXY9_9BRAD|nr:hypothetical protein [Bradyrhizobium canariense]SDT26310.1 hypothetical protein SAMN05444158_5083 [Bradyrhizobium canariense]